MNLHLRSQKGSGLASALVAIALMAITAGVISYFVLNLQKASLNLGAKSSCSEIANSLSNYLRQDGASTFINSVGIDSDGTFANYADSVINLDGNPAYAFIGIYNNSRVINMSVASLAAPNAETPLSSVIPAGATFQLLNYLNIRNSVGRMVSLATLVDLCNGARVFSSSDKSGLSFIDGVSIDKPDVSITLKADFLEAGVSLCEKPGLSRLPTLQKGLIIKYEVLVSMNEQLANSEQCRSSGALNLSSDLSAPLTVMHISSIDPTGKCVTEKDPNTYCISGVKRQTSAIVASVHTVKATANCSACLKSNSSRYGSCGIDVLNTNVEAACASQCENSDPGSVFFCRLIHREQTTGLSNWWPCHQKPSSIPGVVSIAYEDISAALSSTQTTTQAVIRVTALPAARDWLLDVRAVDTMGAMLGPSFSSISSLAVPTPEAPYEIPTGFRDCSCDGSCVWRVVSSTGTCPTGPAPVCGVGVLAGEEVAVAPYSVTQTYQCEHPAFVGTFIADHNCVKPKPNSTVNCTLPCVAGTPPGYACDYTAAVLGACLGSPGSQTSTGVCRQIPGGAVVASSNCASDNACVRSVSCYVPPPTAQCENWTWTNCTPTCTQSCVSTRKGECRLTDGTLVDPANCTNRCEETRTDYATGCAFTCDTSAAVASSCSAGPCNLPGIKTYTGAVCRDTNNGNAIVDVANCGGSCNPEPTACDRGCASSCVDTGAWTPPSCTTPCGATTPNQRSRPTTCQFSDGTACTTVCPDRTENCPETTCLACGSTPHGESVLTPTFTANQTTCEQMTCVNGDTFEQVCSNGSLVPAALPANIYTSCVDRNLIMGVWKCPPDYNFQHENLCIEPKPYWQSCTHGQPACVQPNGQPADCCNPPGGHGNCGKCYEGETNEC